MSIHQIIQIPPSPRPSILLTLNPAPISSPEPATRSGAPSSGDAEAAKTFAITSVAWAPSCGRSYHLIATGSRDGHVRIWRVKPPTPSEDSDGVEDGAEKWSASILGDFDDHKCASGHSCACDSLIIIAFARSTVGRVEWNITGYVHHASRLLGGY